MRAYYRQTIFFSFWLLAMAAMAFQAEKRLLHGQPSGRSKGPLYLLLGSAKEAIGDAIFLKANSYFHGGIDSNLVPREAMAENEGAGGVELDTFKKAYTDWVYQVNSRIKVLDHRHLEGAETRQIIPLLKISVALDPYNVPAILTTAYWLEFYFKKTDDSIEVLNQGLEYNPDSWEILYHLGLDYFKFKKKYAEGALCLENALAKMNTENSNSIDHRTVSYFLGECYLNQGSNGAALNAYRKALTYFETYENPPIKAVIAEKIKTLSG